MDCSTDALMQAAKCFRCIPAGTLPEVSTYLMCQWANKPATAPCQSAVVDGWVTRVATNLGRKPTDAQTLALCQFMTGMDSAGLTSKMISVCPFCPPDSVGGALFVGELRRAITPLIVGPGLDPWTNTAFVTADLTSDGLIGDGATKFLNTGVNPLTAVSNDTEFGMTIYHVSAINVDAFEIGIINTGRTGLISSGFTVNAAWSAWDNTANGQVTVANALWKGFISGNRISAVNSAIYKASSVQPFTTLGSIAATSGTRPNGNIFCFATNFAGPANFFTTRRISFAAIHHGLTSGEAQTFFNLIQALRVAFQGGFV